MAQGPNPAGSSRHGGKVPNLHQLPVKATPKVKASPNRAKTSKRTGPLGDGGRGARIARGC